MVLRIQASTSKGVNRVVVFVKNLNEVIILSPKTYRSTFAKRFILDRFDAVAYRNPLFAQAANPRNSPFFLKADGVQILDGGTKIILRAGGGYQVEADLRTNLAKMPSVKDPLPFAFHRDCMTNGRAKWPKLQSAGAKDSKFHIIQTNLPRFTGQRTRVVSEETQSLSAIAAELWSRPKRSEPVHGQDRITRLSRATQSRFQARDTIFFRRGFSWTKRPSGVC